MKKELMLVFCLVFLTGFVVAMQKDLTGIEKSGFCGSSTNAPCLSNSDCKAGGCSAQICGSINESAVTTCEYTECYNAPSYSLICGCSENKCKWISSNTPTPYKCAKEEELCAGVANISCCEGLNCKIGGYLGTSGKCVSLSKTKECITNEDCGLQETCPDGTNYYVQLCINKTCEGLSFTGGTPCFNENGKISDVNQTKKRINPEIQNQSECPENCTCSGSTVKCMINGQREMIITAGKSGNIIVQIKGENMSTNVTLYKANEKIYGVFKDNETKEVKMMPDQVAEKIKERLQQREEKYNITLDENGIYQVQTKKKAKLFYLFPVRKKTQLELSSESGEIIKVRNPWWGFLAKDIKEQLLVGSSCGTVTPGYNDACCQTKGYDVWNATSSNCEFN